MDDTDERRDVCPQPGQLGVLAGDCLLQGGDSCAQLLLDLGHPAVLGDALVELRLQVGVSLGQCITRNSCLQREGNNGSRSIGPFRCPGQDAVHSGADAVTFIESGRHPASSVIVTRVRSWVSA
ncbi:hypothetical protein [Amycolatopsis sp. H20-H5]|uniref:hypothetical protein n=1 Tax=Amycolatopsis sp. H20-H5 TaxID=3046309 RepID=UPI002DC039C3|nr:hypothetical protein [Amycolatopsis sp. H20-H5]MEC3977723.1 hypothetical protein [Amycolatopsis sp. H20-H5]